MIEALERDVRETSTDFIVRQSDGGVLYLRKRPHEAFNEQVLLFVWPRFGLPRAHVVYRSRMAITLEY